MTKQQETEDQVRVLIQVRNHLMSDESPLARNLKKVLQAEAFAHDDDSWQFADAKQSLEYFEDCRTLNSALGTGATSRQDVLSLYQVEGLDQELFYISDSIITTLIENEPIPMSKVYVQNLSAITGWLDASGDASLDIQSKKIKDRTIAEPFFGWPFDKITDETEMILIPYNPSANHWVVIEISQPDPPSVKLYNPMSTRKGKGHALNVAREQIPHLLHLTSLKTDSPLGTHGYNWENIQVVDADCPQQAGTADCGAFAIYIIVGHMHQETLPQALAGEEDRLALGQWIRTECAKRLASISYGSAGSSDLFHPLFRKDQIDRLESQVSTEKASRDLDTGDQPKREESVSDEVITLEGRLEMMCILSIETGMYFEDPS